LNDIKFTPDLSRSIPRSLKMIGEAVKNLILWIYTLFFRAGIFIGWKFWRERE